MGKRSNFDRKSKDFYETPVEAIAPLAKHIKFGARYIDPCYGGGNITRHLYAVADWAECVGRYELFPENYKQDCGIITADATSHIYMNNRSNMFITNPPWDRSKKNGETLHKIINNLAGQKPTWLLFDADWMHTIQAAEYMKYCVKVVSIGRVKWFEDSKFSGKDNVCWYLFDKNKAGCKTQFIGR